MLSVGSVVRHSSADDVVGIGMICWVGWIFGGLGARWLRLGLIGFGNDDIALQKSRRFEDFKLSKVGSFTL